MWWTFFILFILISIISSTLLYFSLRRINQYEEIILQFQQIIQFSSEKIKQIFNSLRCGFRLLLKL